MGCHGAKRVQHDNRKFDIDIEAFDFLTYPILPCDISKLRCVDISKHWIRYTVSIYQVLYFDISKKSIRHPTPTRINSNISPETAQNTKPGHHVSMGAWTINEPRDEKIKQPGPAVVRHNTYLWGNHELGQEDIPISPLFSVPIIINDTTTYSHPPTPFVVSPK